jgi:hypothetical protein
MAGFAHLELAYNPLIGGGFGDVREIGNSAGTGTRAKVLNGGV